MKQDEIQAVALKPCPFCGGDKARTIHIRDGRKVACICGACGKPEFNGPLDRPDAETRAIAAWNTRAHPPADRVAQVVEWLRKENGICDCHARCETECGCGAWDDWKTKPLLQIADQIEQGEPFNG